MSSRSLIAAAVCSLAVTSVGLADSVRLKNGDTLNGTVVKLDATSLILESANFGELTIAREKVALIALGEQALPASHIAQPQTGQQPQPLQSLVPSLQSPQIQQQLNQLFGEALGGKSVQDFQSDIDTARRQLKELQEDFGEGPEAEALGAYLRLLEQFAPAPQPQSQPDAAPQNP